MKTLEEKKMIIKAVDDTRISIAAPAATEFCPAVPSVILTVSAINT